MHRAAGITAAVTPCLTLVVEITPTRIRTAVTSFYIVFATAGALLASATSAALLAALGWRGVAMLGAVTIPVGIMIAILVPESVRWLAAKGRFAEARAGGTATVLAAGAIAAAEHRASGTTEW